MQNEWIIDVLTDLRHFSEKRGMHATASALRDVCLVALAELAELEAAGNAQTGLNAGHEGKTGKPCHPLAGSDVA